ncbi:MAG: hypothetical protein GVY32_08235 [Gammaproteobacteria bacterium]|jgi:hypothetical protein|nr:hypothetical protein [Gammaproteobacteria bacterium]
MVTRLLRLLVEIVSCTLLIGLLTPVQADWFEDVAESAGVDFRYDSGMQGQFFFPEIMGGGAALLDYDRDGLLDLYLVQGGAIGPGIGPDERQRGDRLYRNVSRQDEDGQWRLAFEDVTEAAGIDARGYGMGAAVGDYDGNGYPDLYILNFGDNQLWRNDGDGTFTDVTAEVGVNDPRWSVSGSFADHDGDGLLDLMVVNYADYSVEDNKVCRASGTSRQDYCSPSAYPPAGDSLFRNLGQGRFEDVTASAGLGDDKGHGLGVISADLDGDGRVDIYVANDGSPNYFWINRGEGRFSDDAMLAGNAVNSDGASEASMGVDAGDYDDDGDEDIFLTHLRRESNTLYRNDGQGWFDDVSNASGLASPSLPMTGFGTAFVDVDLDGRLDLPVVNGAVTEEPELAAKDDPFPYHQPNQLFLGGEGGRFADRSADAGAAFSRSRSSRGAAFGDLDNDGRVDMVVVNVNAPAEVLLNRMSPEARWLGIEPVDAEGRIVTGTRAWLVDGERLRLLRRSRRDGSYASASDPRIVLGLGARSDAVEVELRWPDGLRERFGPLDVGRYHRLTRATGEESNL